MRSSLSRSAGCGRISTHLNPGSSGRTPASLERLELTAQTVRGPIRFKSQGYPGSRELTLELPPGCEGELVLPEKEIVNLVPLPKQVPGKPIRYLLPASQEVTMSLKYT